MENAAAFATMVLINSILLNSNSLRLMFLFRIISCWNYREANVKYITPKTNIIIVFFFIVNHKFWARKTSHGDVFTHQKLILLQTVIKIYHEQVRFSEASVPQN